jgi:hypothetical protein
LARILVFVAAHVLRAALMLIALATGLESLLGIVREVAGILVLILLHVAIFIVGHRSHSFVGGSK